MGLSVFDNVGKCVAHTCIKTKQGWSDHQTIDHIVREFFDFIEPYLVENAQGKSLTAIYIEHILFGKTGKATTRAEVVGILKWQLRQDGHPLFGVTPKAVNSFLAARFDLKYPTGRKDGLTTAQRSKRIKQITMDALHYNCNFFTRDDNVADAYAIGMFGLAHGVEKLRLSAVPLYKILG